MVTHCNYMIKLDLLRVGRELNAKQSLEEGSLLVAHGVTKSCQPLVPFVHPEINCVSDGLIGKEAENFSFIGWLADCRFDSGTYSKPPPFSGRGIEIVTVVEVNGVEPMTSRMQI